jgi:hypothetical protein
MSKFSLTSRQDRGTGGLRLACSLACWGQTRSGAEACYEGPNLVSVDLDVIAHHQISIFQRKRLHTCLMIGSCGGLLQVFTPLDLFAVWGLVGGRGVSPVDVRPNRSMLLSATPILRQSKTGSSGWLVVAVLSYSLLIGPDKVSLHQHHGFQPFFRQVQG